MKNSILLVLISFLAAPSLSLAGEQSKGTLIMMSSLGGWVLIICGYVFIREMQRTRKDRNKSLNDE